MSVRISLIDLNDPNTLVQALQQALRFVPQIHWFEVPFPVAGDPVSVYHKLGETPAGMVFDAISSALVWATMEDRREWGAQRVVVRCNVSGATMRIGLIV